MKYARFSHNMPPIRNFSTYPDAGQSLFQQLFCEEEKRERYCWYINGGGGCGRTQMNDPFETGIHTGICGFIYTYGCGLFAVTFRLCFFPFYSQSFSQLANFGCCFGSLWHYAGVLAHVSLHPKLACDHNNYNGRTIGPTPLLTCRSSMENSGSTKHIIGTL